MPKTFPIAVIAQPTPATSPPSSSAVEALAAKSRPAASVLPRRWDDAIVSGAVALGIPGLAAWLFVHWFSGRYHLHQESNLGMAVSLLVFVMLGMVGLAKCSPLYMLSGGVALLVGHWALGDVFLAGGMAVALTAVGSLALGHFLYDEVLKPAPASVAPEGCGVTFIEAQASLNPKCDTCYANKFCPMQPGGLVDQYTGKNTGKTVQPSV